MGIEWAERARRACGATQDAPPLQLWRERHSVLYAMEFWIEVEGATERAWTHLAKTNPGWYAWTHTSRPDRKNRQADGLRDFVVKCNPEALINLAQKRLCQHAWAETREVVLAIRAGVREYAPELAAVMQPRCVWERGCRQAHPCGWYTGQKLEGDK